MTVSVETHYAIQSGGSLGGEICIPGDKSISHRAIMLSAIAEGEGHVSGLLEGTDVLATVTAFRHMGVNLRRQGAGAYLIEGVGRTGLRAPHRPLDMGNSGTAMRLLTGLLAGQSFGVTLTGDESLSRRPMLRVAAPLREMGALVDTGEAGTPPVVIAPCPGLTAIRYSLPVPSAQVKSAILLAGLYARGETCVIEAETTRDHTERMLRGFGYECVDRDGAITLQGGGVLRGQNLEVPADLSSAAFFIVGCCIARDSRVLIKRVGVNPTRLGVINILRKMGADIILAGRREICGEPVADILVKSSPLRGIEVPDEEISLAIDELPVICVAAACARGVTVVRGAQELRHKESDRIAAMTAGLRSLGVEVDEFSDGLRITGGRPRGGVVDSHGDHRIAMAFCVAALGADGEITVRDCANVATSFPGFVSTAARAGLRIHAGG